MEFEETFKNNFNTLKEIIFDEEKIVTYISLSKDLCIHINTGKQLLHRLVDKIREENPKVKLNVSYIISGIIGDNKAWTTVCPQEELKKLRLTFKIIFFEHIYSVSKGASRVDPTVYLLLNSFEDFNLCKGLIKSNECTKRTSVEIGSLKSNSQESELNANESQQLVPSKQIKLESKHVLNSLQNSKDTCSSETLKEEDKPVVKSEVTSPKKELNRKKANNTSNGQKTQKGIAGFFNKTNGIINKTEIKEVINTPVVHNENNNKKEEPKLDVDDEESGSKLVKKEIIKKNKIHNENSNKKEEPKMDVDGEESGSKLVKQEINKKNKILNEIKKSSKVDKKRKRVLHVSDSDSDTENDPFADNKELNYESDDEIPPTPSNNSIKITSGIVNPKKRRKVVDKTYTDEDGYILTKKEEIYESCSDQEEDQEMKEDIKPIKEEKNNISPKEKKNSPKVSKKKISPPQKGKQSTLTNFFKKM